MLKRTNPGEFPVINQAYNTVFEPNKLSIGLVLPIEAYPVGAEPAMETHLETAKLAEELGFSALWLRDVPFNVPSFGDAGQMFDPYVYLGTLAAVTTNIALGTASIILPLRHPAHVAKAAATADVLSRGRLLLGVASGDRPEEYPALQKSFIDRGERFRDSFDYIRAVANSYPHYEGTQGVLAGNIDMLPKPVGGQVPILITGGSQQSPDWVAQNGDGWMTYPRDTSSQARVIKEYRSRIADAGIQNKPVMQSLYVDLQDDAEAPPRPIHLGFQSGVGFLREYLTQLRELGINHVALNLRFNQANIQTTLQRLANELLPTFKH
ncbi:LLM class oxidoreductase [Kiloniella majae]|uniref:LLM class oxidoreductase n=1 Tax=Kiloniella majae TaxID=1938558 RepID=UPI000A277375|nr:LLM class oxidoreductase [Kiloniella majae]